MGIAFLIIAGALGIGIWIGLKQAKVNKQLYEDGRMIVRNASFVETAEIFTLQGADFKKVADILMGDYSDLEGTGVTIRVADEARKILFNSNCGWSAVLAAQASTEGTYSYIFNFTQWNTRNGVAQNMTSMNVALTGIEKLFIKLDPNTKVTTQRIKTKSKTSFI